MFLPACLSALTEVAITHPIDNYKTLIQNANLNKTKNTYFNLCNMYRGVLPRIIGVVPMRIVFWTSLDFLNSPNNSKFDSFVVGSLAGGFQTLVDTPIESLKIHQMTKNINYDYDYKKNNTRFKLTNIYKGFSPTICRNSLFAGIFNTILYSSNTQNYTDLFLLSGLAGLSASILSHPFDVIKTEMQKYDSKTKSMSKFISYNIQNNPKIFLSGLKNRCLLSLVSMSVGLTSLQLFYKLLN